ncbi:MAG TPA: ABC transporter substrate-binding protein [Methanospirillum sp.]|uniref:ABC transporter substrate-binding protein n=1 Tax=Methanospirillum sp. TaxID=45200 RepID=UPI002B6DF1D6|nr:ABC transporter substrate-binding protein [Methanospirillum sp.]HWQ63458.1 ABC transporter substrate-binding protein [Methanospirillum sp.]
MNHDGWLVHRTVILCFIVFSVFLFCSVTADTNQNPKDEIVVYGIYPTSGDLAQKGIEGKAAASLAIENLKTVYADIGSDRTYSLNSTDISSDPDSALAAVKSLHESGVNLIIGTLSSAQLEAIKPYADSNGVVIVATGSSATSLTIPDDNIFRLNPDDSSEEAALNSLLQKENIGYVIPLVREDSWSNFQGETILNRSMKSLSSDEVVRYNASATDYKEIVSRLDSLVGSALDREDKSSVAVLAFTFDDIIPIMEEASSSAYPNLSLVQWIGTDGNTFGQKLLKSEKAADFADQRKFSGYTLTLVDLFSSKIPLQMKEKIGYEPDGYAFSAYEAADIAAQVLSMHGSQEAKQLKEALVSVIEKYHGISGSMSINAAGDKTRASYGFFTLEKDSSGNFVWKNIGDWMKWADSAVPSVRNPDNVDAWYPVNSS